MAACKEWYALYNIIFDWIHEKYGPAEFDEYIDNMTRSCFIKQIDNIKRDGLLAIKNYYRDLFDEDETEYTITETTDSLYFNISNCIEHEVIKSFSYNNGVACKHYCRHHLIMNRIFVEGTDITFAMPKCSGFGSCQWVFTEKERETL